MCECGILDNCSVDSHPVAVEGRHQEAAFFFVTVTGEDDQGCISKKRRKNIVSKCAKGLWICAEDGACAGGCASQGDALAGAPDSERIADPVPGFGEKQPGVIEELIELERVELPSGGGPAA